jgi:DNA-binding NtrC family response regulator
MKKYRILLVDDDTTILAGLGKDLEFEGYRVTTATSGEEAVRILENRRFDLVLTDLVMDHVDGMAVVQKAKKANPETRAIILTGYGDMESAINALRSDADDFLLKSTDVDEIQIKVSRCLEKLELLRQIKIYERILPVCCVCKKVRRDVGRKNKKIEWVGMEEYIKERSGVDFTHTYCPKCFSEHQKKLFDG